VVYLAVGGVAAAVGVIGTVVLVRRAHGKSLAILGPRQAGKTTLATFLQSGEIPRGYRPTVLRTTVHGRQQVPGTGRRIWLGIKMRDVALKLTMLDNPGMTPYGDLTKLRMWQESVKNADLICYLVDVTQLRQGAYGQVAQNGARHIVRWDEDGSHRRLLILTHCDLDAAWAQGDPDKITGRSEVKELLQQLKAENVIIGSLKDESGTRDLTYDLLQVLVR
jgi:GTPase SAR1 family protein